MLKREMDRSARVERALVSSRRSRDTGAVKDSLDHLPEGKRRELQFVVDTLVDSFSKEIATRWSKHLNQEQILKIILFGSYARGDWVEDPVGRYFSDYDLLVVVDKEKLTDVVEFWEGAEKALLVELSAGARLRTPVNFIVHTLEDVNDQLRRGRYFFIDIIRDGIMLLDLPGYPFVGPTSLVPAKALEEAQKFYDDYMGAAFGFLDTAKYVLKEKRLKEAAFQLHQATENAYNGMLLVMTLYTPKSHNLVRLRSLCEPLDNTLTSVWPTDTKFDKRCFELLRAAYVKARYSQAYEISTRELEWIQERVALLQNLVKDICEARLAELRAACI